MKPKVNRLLVSLIFMICGLLEGCYVQSAEIPNSTDTVQPVLPTQSPIIPTETNTSTPTSENKISTAIFTATNEPLRATPQATLSVSDSTSLVLDLLRDNGGCQFPCVWGMVPGETDLASIQAFQDRLANIATSYTFDNSGSSAFELPQDTQKVLVELAYYQQHDYVDKFVVNSFGFRQLEEDPYLEVTKVFGALPTTSIVKYYLPSNILKNYGRPSRVLIAGFYDDRLPPTKADWLFSLVLDYSESGFVVEYLMNGKSSGEYFIGCLEDSRYINGWFVSNQDGLGVEDIIKKPDGTSMGGINSLNVSWFKPLETANSMTLDDFYDAFIDPTVKSCVRTPVSLWRP